MVLKTERFGEIHKRLVMLTATLGIIEAVAYGAFKGKNRLSGSTDLFSLFKAYLYFEPVKKNYKLSDIEPIASYDGIRRDVKRFYIASLWAEIIHKTYAGGDEHARIFPLVSTGFEYLETADTMASDLICTQFLNRFLEVIGYPPLASECERCGRMLGNDVESFVGRHGTVTCNDCAFPESAVVTPGAKRYLASSKKRDFARAVSISLETGSLNGIKEALLRIVRAVVERPLYTLETGGKFL